MSSYRSGTGSPISHIYEEIDLHAEAIRGRKVDAEKIKTIITELQICANDFTQIINSLEEIDLEKNIDGVEYTNTKENIEKLKQYLECGDQVVNITGKLKVAFDRLISNNDILYNENLNLTKKWCGEKKRVIELIQENKILRDINSTLSEEKNECRQQLERLQNDRETYNFIMSSERENVLSETINQLLSENETLKKDLQDKNDCLISFTKNFNKQSKDNFIPDFINNNHVNSALKIERPNSQLNRPLHSLIDHKNSEEKTVEPVEIITVGKCSLRDALDVIPKYDGKTNSIRGFISSCRSALELLDPQWTQAFMLSIKNKITDPKISLIANTEFSSLDELELLLRTVTYTGKSFESLWNELSTVLINDNENVDEYGSRVLKLYNDLIDCNEGNNDGFGTMSKSKIEEKTIRHFIKGLLPEVCLRVECKNIDTTDFLKVWNITKKIYNEYIDSLKLRKLKEIKTVQTNKIENPSEVVVESNNNFSCNFSYQRYHNNFSKNNNNNFNNNFSNYGQIEPIVSSQNINLNTQKNSNVNLPEIFGSNPVENNNNNINNSYYNSYENSTNDYLQNSYNDNYDFYNFNNSYAPINDSIDNKNLNKNVYNDNGFISYDSSQDEKDYNRTNNNLVCGFCQKPRHDMNHCFKLQNAQRKCLERQAQKNGDGPVDLEGGKQEWPIPQSDQLIQTN